MRVPLDQSGAAAAARWIARSGIARRQRPGEPGQPGGEDEGLSVRPAARGAGQKLQVGAGVRLHRARDVAQHHQSPGRDPPAAAGQAERVAAGAEAAAQRPPHIDALPVAASARSDGCVRTGVASCSCDINR